MHNLLYITIFITLAMPVKAALADTLTIIGWPFPDTDQAEPDRTIGTDPILGRLACPGLTRLDLLKKRSQPFLVSSVTVEAKKWEYVLDQRLQWWNGDKVGKEEIAKFIERELPQLVKQRGAGTWPMPQFKASGGAKETVAVEFAEKPSFGPFILNEVPLYRKRKAASGKDSSSFAYECAGPYRLDREKGRLILSKVSSGKKTEKVVFWSEGKSSAKDVHPEGSWLKFQFGKDFSADIRNRPPDKPVGCDRVIDLPIVTAISWTASEGPIADKGFRQLLTQLIPRGALLRAGAGFLGDLVSGPILRGHPGYNKAVLVREFDLNKGGEELTRLGYKRDSRDGPRLDPKGSAVKLNIRAPSRSSGLVEKVIVDGYASVGIMTTFERSQHKPVDGELLSVRLPWPDSDFVDDFHSKSASPRRFAKVNDSDLDELLDRYGLSLTQKEPDFELLKAIHEKLYDLEPFTIIMQHQACIESSVGKNQKALPPIKIRNPDWFWDLVD